MLRNAFSLFLCTVCIAAESNVKPDAVAGNEAVKKIMETYAGRGTLADDTPMKSPADALKSFTTRSDVAVDLVLHEPEVCQPLHQSFDSRGRLWVTQYRQYQFPAGLKVVAYDQHLRAKFDKVPQPPPLGVKGDDIITVHEDTDGDGLYDSTKIVLSGLNIATSCVKGAGGIWVMNPPYLLFYPDANDDDVPDADPSVELRGFGIEDTHSVANNIQFGPDGWIYGVNGSTTTGNVSSAATKNVKWEGQMVWRFHPVTKVFEIYGEGGGNPFSLDIDSKGRVFTGTNGGGTRGMHFDQGMYGIKNWGKHGPLTNPYAFGYFEHMAGEGDKRRFPQAFTVYEGGVLGSNYEGHIIAPNALANVVWVSELIATGSTFKTKDEENLMTTTDRWFRPVHSCSGPDGCMYIADWYDTRLSHVRPVDDWHKGSGRIYRVRPASGAPKLEKFDLHTESPERLLSYLSSSNEWFRKQAVNEIGWRGLKELVPQLTTMVKEQDNSHALDALFAMTALQAGRMGVPPVPGAGGILPDSKVSNSKDAEPGKMPGSLGTGGTPILRSAVTDELAAELLTHRDPFVRRWALRVIGDEGARWQASGQPLAELAKRETHPEVTNQLAATAKRLPASTAIPLLASLAQTHIETITTSTPANENRLPLLTWWALEAKAESSRDQALALFEDKVLWATPLAKATWIKNLAKRYALAGGELNFQSCAKLLSLAPDDDSRALVVSGIAEAFEGAEMPPLPESLSKALADYMKKQGGDDLALAMRSGDDKAVKKALAMVKDKAAPVAKRGALALVLAELGKTDAIAPITAIFSAGSNEALKRALLPAVAKFGDHKIIRAMLDGWEQRMASDKLLREAALRLMAGREEWAKMLLAEVALWHVPTKHFTPDIVRQLSVFKDPEITAAIDKNWPGLLAVAPTEETLKEAVRIKNVLRAGAGDAAKGKLLFAQRCAICHKLFGEGNAIGPELTGYERGSIDFWLTAILTPSIEIREGFGNYVVKLKSGQILSGIMASQDAKGISLRDVANNVTPVKQADIVSLEATPVSLMAPGLFTGMTDEQLRDLFAWAMRVE